MTQIKRIYVDFIYICVNLKNPRHLRAPKYFIYARNRKKILSKRRV
jgi:hypothetical protein